VERNEVQKQLELPFAGNLIGRADLEDDRCNHSFELAEAVVDRIGRHAWDVDAAEVAFACRLAGRTPPRVRLPEVEHQEDAVLGAGIGEAVEEETGHVVVLRGHAGVKLLEERLEQERGRGRRPPAARATVSVRYSDSV
jgi:hypothetical protein